MIFISFSWSFNSIIVTYCVPRRDLVKVCFNFLGGEEKDIILVFLLVENSKAQLWVLATVIKWRMCLAIVEIVNVIFYLTYNVSAALQHGNVQKFKHCSMQTSK